MLNMFKSGWTKQGEKWVANTVQTPQLNKVKTCLFKMCLQGGLKFVCSKWLQNVIGKWDEPNPGLIKLVSFVWMGYTICVS